METVQAADIESRLAGANLTDKERIVIRQQLGLALSKADHQALGRIEDREWTKALHSAKRKLGMK